MDQSQAILEKAKKGIEGSIKRVAKKQFGDDENVKIKVNRNYSFQQQTSLVSRVLKNINLSTNVEEAVSKADLVIEAIVENVDAKQKLFAQVESAIPRYNL